MGQVVPVNWYDVGAPPLENSTLYSKIFLLLKKSTPREFSSLSCWPLLAGYRCFHITEMHQYIRGGAMLRGFFIVRRVDEFFTAMTEKKRIRISDQTIIYGESSRLVYNWPKM